MTTDPDIARWRLRSQRLVTPHAGGAEDVVRGLLAVQAENPSQSAWAVACRTEEPRQDDLGSLLASSAVLRTHVLRPTWHYVSADDLVWLTELTAPRVLRAVDQLLVKQYAYDDAEFDRAAADVLDVLGDRHLTRPEVDAGLRERGRSLDGQGLMLLLAHLELCLHLCSGAPADGVHTYAAVASRVPSPRRLARDEALAELALRYFTSHGPATERDLAYWATLTLTDVRSGLAAVADRLASFEHDGRTYWHAPGEGPPAGGAGAGEPRGHLLQILDEMYRGYQDSRMVLDADDLAPAGGDLGLGMSLVDGQLVAAMKRTVTETRVAFDLTPLRALTTEERRVLEDAASRYGDFLARTPELRWR
jgi:hypothetical protein